MYRWESSSDEYLIGIVSAWNVESTFTPTHVCVYMQKALEAEALPKSAKLRDFDMQKHNHQPLISFASQGAQTHPHCDVHLSLPSPCSPFKSLHMMHFHALS